MVATPSTLTVAPRRAYGLAGVLTAFGVAFVLFGWLIPSQFKSVPVSILAGAGEDTPGLAKLMRTELDAGRPGAAAIVVEAAKVVKLPHAELLGERVDDFSHDHPDLLLWGEANPFLRNALPGAVPGNSAVPAGGIIRQFLPAAARKSVLDFLSQSPNATTRAILATRGINSYQQFLPVISAGGAPLDATILLAAMLVQSRDLDDTAIDQLKELADDAVRTGDTRRLEITYLDLLAMGRRYNWGQLAAVTRGVTSLKTLSKLRHLLRVAPESSAVIGAAVIMSRQPDRVGDFLLKYGPHGRDALAYALFHGTGSVALLLKQQLPVDGDLTLPPKAEHHATDALVRFALESPGLAVVVKIVLYLIGGLLVFLAAERITALRQLEYSPLFSFMARGIGACVICLFLVLVNEPYLALGSQPSGYELKLVIPVIGTSTETATMPDKSFPLDWPTMLSIAFFFGLQAFVFSICRAKLKEIDSKSLSSALKFRLVENEENLFDSGLYVGIAGTCGALVLQVLHLIQSNLLAAYSSNLFGILCVAIIKIRFVRPFKHRLILEQTDGSKPQPPSESPTPVVPAAPKPVRVA